MCFILFHWMRGTWIRLRLIEQIEYSNIVNYSTFLGLTRSSNFYLFYSVFNTFNWIWISGLLILLISLGVSFLGYCLCFGQMSYWGITVIINVFSIIPFFGFYIGSYLWCSSLVVLGRVFIFHFVFGFILAFLILVHLVLLHLLSSFNLVSNNYSTVIPFYSLFFKDCFVLNFVGILFCLCLFFEPDIFGSCDNLVFANPMSTPTHIVPEWYFLVFYCILRAFPNKTIGVILVIIFISYFFDFLLFISYIIYLFSSS